MFSKQVTRLTIGLPDMRLCQKKGVKSYACVPLKKIFGKYKIKEAPLLTVLEFLKEGSATNIGPDFLRFLSLLNLLL